MTSGAESTAKWRRKHPDRARAAKLKYQFGITNEQYEEMIRQQDGLCAICQQPERVVDPRAGRIRRLCIDHSHATGRVRGLLCAGCNKALGNLGESVDNLLRAAAYLQKWSGL